MMKQHDVHTSDASVLATLMRLDKSSAALWQPHEIAAILKHQLRTALKDELASLAMQTEEQLAALMAGALPPIVTFGDLLHHAHPPVELLRLLKEYAKRSRMDEEYLADPEVAMVLYFAAIGIARARCDQRITDLSDGAVRNGLRWALGHSWLDDQTRAALQEALAAAPDDEADLSHG